MINTYKIQPVVNKNRPQDKRYEPTVKTLNARIGLGTCLTFREVWDKKLNKKTL